jgi:hypothetical protein
MDKHRRTSDKSRTVTTQRTTLQSACELRSDGGCNVTAMPLWVVRELCDDGEWQHNKCHAIARNVVAHDTAN